MDKTFDEAITGVRKAERGVEVREDLAQGFEYVKQYAEEVISRQKEAVQSAETATAQAKTAAEQANTATSKASAAASSATAAANSQTASSQSAAAAKASADAAAKSAQDAAAAANTDTTLSISGAPADAKAVGGRLAAVYTKAEIDALLANLNVCPFEIGDILQTTSSVSPAARFGGTWEEIAPNRVLMGASSSHAAGTTAEAGLPNITGTIGQIPNNDYVGNWQSIYANGAFSAADDLALNYPDSGSRDTAKITFDASKSSAVYGRSSTVQPAAYYVHIWQRKA